MNELRNILVISSAAARPGISTDAEDLKQQEEGTEDIDVIKESTV